MATFGAEEEPWEGNRLEGRGDGLEKIIFDRRLLTQTTVMKRTRSRSCNSDSPCRSPTAKGLPFRTPTGDPGTEARSAADRYGISRGYRVAIGSNHLWIFGCCGDLSVLARPSRCPSSGGPAVQVLQQPAVILASGLVYSASSPGASHQNSLSLSGVLACMLYQIYCPLDDPPDAFHRMLYLFCCSDGSCVRRGR